MSVGSADDTAVAEKIESLKDRIHELEACEANLKERLLCLESVLDGMMEMVVAKGAKQQIVYANKAFCDFYGMSEAELLGRTALPGEDNAERAQQQSREAEVLERGRLNFARGEVWTRPSGQELRLDVARSPTHMGEGAPPLIITVARGTLVQGEEVTHERAAEYWGVLRKVMPDIVFRHDRNGIYLDYSVPDESVLAVPPSVFLGKTVKELFPDLAPQFMENLHRALETREIQTSEYSLLLGPEPSHFEMRFVPMGDEIFAVVRDVTQQKQVHETLRESEARFRSLVEQSLVGTFMSQGNRFVYVSPRFAEMFGYTQEEVLELPEARDLIAEEDRERARVLFRSLFTAKQIGVRFGFRGLCKDGGSIRVEIHAGKTMLKGRPAIIGTVVDVTEQRHAEEEQRRLQEELLRAQERVLQELSTPLIPISERVVAMPLVGELDEHRLNGVMERLLRGIAESRASAAILDVTGVPHMNMEVADALVRCVRSARLLGTEVLLTGIGAEVARTLATLGVDLKGIVTLATLQAGIRYAMRRG